MQDSPVLIRILAWFLPRHLMESGNAHAIQQAVLVVAFTLSAMIWGPIFAVLNYLVLEIPRLGHISMVSVGLGAIVLAVVRQTGSFRVAGNLFALFIVLELGLVFSQMGGFSAPTVMWAAVVPMVAVLLAGRVAGICWTVIVTAGTVGLFVMYQSGPSIPTLLDPRSAEITRLASLVGVEVLTFSLAFCYESIKQRAERAVFEEQAALRLLLQRQEVERQLLAYDIHDGLTQSLAAALMHQEKGLADQEKLDVAALERARALMRDGLAEARRIIAGLRPPILDEAGLVAGIEYLIAGIENLNVGFRHAVQFDRLEPLLEGSLFRICQEALTNATKYSSARHVQVVLTQDEQSVKLIIEDDGKGFNSSQQHTERHGLAGIRQRTRFLGGTADIESVLGEGTRIVVKVPLQLGST